MMVGAENNNVRRYVLVPCNATASLSCVAYPSYYIRDIFLRQMRVCLAFARLQRCGQASDCASPFSLTSSALTRQISLFPNPAMPLPSLVHCHEHIWLLSFLVVNDTLGFNTFAIITASFVSSWAHQFILV